MSLVCSLPTNEGEDTRTQLRTSAKEAAHKHAASYQYIIIIIIIYIYIAPFPFSSMALYNFEIDNIKKITRVIEFTLIAKNTSYEYAI